MSFKAHSSSRNGSLGASRSRLNRFDEVDWENWKIKVRYFYNSPAVGDQISPLFSEQEFDNRPFIQVKILDSSVVGLLDSGSNVTIVGQGGTELLNLLNLRVFSCRKNCVFTADAKSQEVIGLVHLPVVINSQCHIIEALVVPSLSHDFIFGSDFCRKFAIKIDYLKGRWDIQQNNISLNSSSLYDFKVETCTVDSVNSEQQAIADDLILAFEDISGKDRLGKTNEVQLIIDTGEAKPFRLKQYPLSPYMMKILNDEMDEMLK
ncbi:uncharacterized protein LOC123322274 [Coccinella septempunctata]|uniref:uncharacterized protein LOC123322274 n=1 Tax=Coccinella septempunctata TaxID=41139 RepID=UPI001D0919B8|nr:uncharacterized protein LOC123322274 [Coccinella septempunctata]